MQTLTPRNFGLVIAYLLPGFVFLFGLSFQSPIVRGWLVGGQSATVGGFLYSTLGALAAGLICSTVRWLLIDALHHRTGITRPNWNYNRLQENLGAYTLLEENHYRYYQFYGNTLIAWISGYLLWKTSVLPLKPIYEDVGLVLISVILFLGSRDTLRKYYGRVRALLEDSPTIILGSSRYH